MKLSIAWIFDHIDADWRQQNIANIISELGSKTAEIEAYQQLNSTAQRNTLFMVEITAIEDSLIVVYCPELKKTIDMPLRDHAHNGSFYLVCMINPGVRWAAHTDFSESTAGGEKLLPPFRFEESFVDGSWKSILVDDWIIDVDNKSITHRPDLWSHRGFAREIATILDLPLKPLDQFITQKKIISHASEAVHAQLIIKNEAPTVCKQFCALSIPSVTHTPSIAWMSQRLSLTGSRSINALVDSTNYVMLDIGQPMHAFDAQKVGNNTLIPRMAESGETLALLDGETIKLTPQDLVITNGGTPLALAGIMGGLKSGVHETTSSIIVEAATFDATAIRLSSLRHKKRTESSARFEKTLDPHQPAYALQRFVHLLTEAHIAHTASDTIVSVGTLPQPTIITVSQAFIEHKLGMPLDNKTIIHILTKLGFETSEQDKKYIITVPSIRATKDIAIPEDIVEEIGRIVGYNTIHMQLPLREAAPVNTRDIHKIRALKRYCANSLAMQEICGYALHDENFLHTLGWQPTNAVEIKNPISEHWRRLVTTLAPNLFAAIVQNMADHDHMRFFEWGRVWHNTEQGITEKKSLAGVFYDKKKPLDFYQAKAFLSLLLHELSITVEWQQVETPQEEWCTPYQNATISHHGKKIGRASMIDSSFSEKHLGGGSAFVFELDGDFLLSFEKPRQIYKPSSKYPSVDRDVSMLISLSTTVEHLTKLMASVSSIIQSITLIDFFQQDGWKDKRAVTFRIILQRDDKTLTKEEIDITIAQVIQAVEKTGATIR